MHQVSDWGSGVAIKMGHKARRRSLLDRYVTETWCTSSSSAENQVHGAMGGIESVAAGLAGMVGRGCKVSTTAPVVASVPAWRLARAPDSCARSRGRARTRPNQRHICRTTVAILLGPIAGLGGTQSTIVCLDDDPIDPLLFRSFSQRRLQPASLFTIAIATKVKGGAWRNWSISGCRYRSERIRSAHRRPGILISLGENEANARDMLDPTNGATADRIPASFTGVWTGDEPRIEITERLALRDVSAQPDHSNQSVAVRKNGKVTPNWRFDRPHSPLIW